MQIFLLIFEAASRSSVQWKTGKPQARENQTRNSIEIAPHFPESAAKFSCRRQPAPLPRTKKTPNALRSSGLD